MCEHCRNIQIWRKFDAPKDYLACIAYIQQLVGQGEFELIAEESTCPLEKVKTEDGWADEIMNIRPRKNEFSNMAVISINWTLTLWNGRMTTIT